MNKRLLCNSVVLAILDMQGVQEKLFFFLGSCCPTRPPWRKLHKLPGKRMRYVINTVTSMTIKGILRWFFARHLCSTIHESSISMIYSLASMCVCVVPVCEWCQRRWQPINPFTVQVQISSGLLRVSAGAAGCLQHHGQRHQQQHQTHQRAKPARQLVAKTLTTPHNTPNEDSI